MHYSLFTYCKRLLTLLSLILILSVGISSYSHAKSALTVEVDGKLALCSYEEKGSIVLTVNGGKAPYHFEWPSIKQYTSSIYDLNAGKYTVIITDSEGTQLTKEILIQPPYPLIAKIDYIEPASCGAANGSAKVKILVGRGDPYKIVWSNGLENTKTAENLSAGAHSVEIFDKYNCSTTLYFDIKETGSSLAIKENIQNNSCGSTDKGTISLTVTGGEAPYKYLWSNGEQSAEINNLKSGQYSVDISDASGCSVHKTFEIGNSEQLAVAVEKQDISCSDTNNGWIALNITGGKSPYNIKWQDISESPNERTQLKPGTYTASITDSNGCYAEKTVTINSAIPLVAKIQSAVNMDCNSGIAKGTAWLNIEGGLPPYDIEWQNGIHDKEEISFNESQDLRVVITDAKGCSVQSILKVDLPSSLARTNFSYEMSGFSTSSEMVTNQPIQFTSNTSEEVIAWEWDFGDGNKSLDPNPVHVFKKEGDFEVTLRVHNLYGCSSAYINTVEVTDNSPSIKIPNAFSPNGDGLNDYFIPKFKNMGEFEMSIFNSWGEMLYHDTSLDSKGWDGSHKGVILPPGNYVYKIHFKDLDKKDHEEGGVFTLIR